MLIAVGKAAVFISIYEGCDAIYAVMLKRGASPVVKAKTAGNVIAAGEVELIVVGTKSHHIAVPGSYGTPTNDT